jgi:hypothetical protein
MAEAEKKREIVQTERSIALHRGIFSKYATPVGDSLVSTALAVRASVTAVDATNTMAVGAMVPRLFTFIQQYKQCVSRYH